VTEPRNPAMTHSMPNSTNPEPKYGRSVSLMQAAELLQVSRRTIYNRIRDGQLATIRTHGSQRVLMSSLFDLGVAPPPASIHNQHDAQL